MVFSRRVILGSLLAAGAILPVRGQSVPANRGASLQGYCLSDPRQSPVYFSNIFDTGVSSGIQGVTTQPLSKEFLEYLKGMLDYTTNSNYPASCGAWETAGLASSKKEARELELRKGGKQIVEVIWIYTPDDSSVAASIGRTGQELTTAPAGPPQAIQMWCVGGTVGMAERYWRARRAGLHAAGGRTEPLASLFTGDKLDCTECLDNYKQKSWAKRKALAQRLKPIVADCVAQRFEANLKAKPFLNRVQEHYDAAVAACK